MLRLLICLIVACGVLSGCGGAGSASTPSLATLDAAQVGGLLHGGVLTPADVEPHVVLTDTAGRRYRLRSSSAGKVTLLYFGYTHCPDVCPTTMATLASAMRALPAADAAKIDVVFVSSDPARDTPAVLHAWLGQFDPAFIGLTGSFGTIQKAAATLGITIEPPAKNPDGSYTVTHGAEVIAFDAKGKGYIVYTAGATVDQFTHDIPLILAGKDA